jgi:Flp pilus assembly protein TadD
LLFAAVIALHLGGVFYPGYATWGFNHWSIYSTFIGASAIMIALFLLLPPVNSVLTTCGRLFIKPMASFSPYRGNLIVTSIIALLLFGLMYVFHSRAHVYGDGFAILAAVADPAELKFVGQLYLQIFAILLHRFAVLGLQDLWGLPAETSFALINTVGGVLGVWALYRISWVLGSNTISRWYILLTALTSGAVILFFGYVEHYTWATSLALWALYFSIRHIQGHRSAGKALVLALLASAFHLIVLPYLAVVVLTVAFRKSFAGKLPFGLSFITLSGIIVLSSIAAVSITQFTNLPDVFVPLWPLIDNQYWVLSWTHLLDILNQLVLVAPLGAAFLIYSIVKRKSRSAAVAPEERILAGVTLLTFLAAFWIDPELGAVRDWDLLSFFGFPLSLWGAYRLTRCCPQTTLSGRWLLPVIIVGVVHLLPNLAEKTDLRTAARHLDRMLWESPHYQTDYQNARRAMVWGTTLRNSVREPGMALKYFHRRLSVDSTCVTSWFSIGDWFARRRQYDSAAFYLRRMAALQTDNAGYLLKLAAVEAELQNFPTAQRIMQRCVALSPDDYKVQYTAGLVAAAAGDNDVALSHFLKAMKLLPDAGKPQLNIGRIYLQRNQYDSAYVYLKQALQLLPRDESAYRLLLTSQVALGKLDEARQTFELYRRFYPNAAIDSLISAEPRQ